MMKNALKLESLFHNKAVPLINLLNQSDSFSLSVCVSLFKCVCVCVSQAAGLCSGVSVGEC